MGQPWENTATGQALSKATPTSGTLGSWDDHELWGTRRSPRSPTSPPISASIVSNPFKRRGFRLEIRTVIEDEGGELANMEPGRQAQLAADLPRLGLRGGIPEQAGRGIRPPDPMLPTEAPESAEHDLGNQSKGTRDSSRT